MLRCYQFFLYICVSLFSRNLIYSLLCKFLLEKNQKRKSTQWFIIKNSKRFVIKVAPRVEKTEVFRKGWNFANQIYFASCKMRKHFFYYGRKKYYFFLIFTMELFFTALSYLTVQSTLNINTNQTSKEQCLNLEAATYFRVSRTRRLE